MVDPQVVELHIVPANPLRSLYAEASVVRLHVVRLAHYGEAKLKAYRDLEAVTDSLLVAYIQ